MSSLHQELPHPDLLDRLGDAPGPLSVVNTRSGRVSACNEAFAALLDLDVTTATGVRSPSLVAPEDRDGIESVFAGLASGLLDSCQGRARLTAHDGDVVDVLLRVQPVDADRPRTQVVLAVTPAGAAGSSDAGPALLPGDEDPSRLALCVVGDDGRIAELSEDVKDLPDRVAHVLAESALAPEALCLGCTESTLMEDCAEERVERLHALGAHVAVDDFGAGYSSLLYLRRFPLRTVRLHRAFVGGLGREPADTSIVKATIDLAHALGLDVVATGVDNAEQLGVLHDLVCDLVQGSFVAPPLPAAEATAYLQG